MKSHFSSCPTPHQAQKGAVLVIGLLLLSAMTLLAVTMANNNLLGSRIALNYAQQSRDFQAAETAAWKTIRHGACQNLADIARGTYVDCKAHIFPDGPTSSTAHLLKILISTEGTSLEDDGKIGEVIYESRVQVGSIRLALGAVEE